VRPEHLRLDGAGVPITVTLVEPTGSETQVTGRSGEAIVVGAFRERISAKVGETIHVMPDPALAHLFHGETGQRLN
jgi:multiple sugar transport system ATP-binding protein